MKSHAAKPQNYSSDLATIILLLKEIESPLLAAGFKSYKPYSSESIQAFKQLASEQRQHIIKSTEKYLTIIKNLDIEPDSERESADEDIAYLKKAMDVLGLRLGYGDDYSFVKQGLVIEIYTADMTQMYRNFEFYRQCSYDHLSLITIPWMQLYERSGAVTEAILASCKVCLENSSKTFYYDNVPKHTLRERFLNHSKIFLNEMKSLTPLFSQKDGSIQAFINCVDSKLVSEGEQAEKIVHLRK